MTRTTSLRSTRRLVIVGAAFATALAAVLLALPAGAAEWCANGTIWTFHSGQTPYTFNCTSGSNNSTAAYAYAQAECQDAWDDVDHLVTNLGGHVTQLSPVQAFPWSNDILRWNYACRACIQGYPPAWAHEVEHQVRISAGDAGGIGGGVVGGVVVSVKLKGLGDETGPEWWVDVVKGSETVQVIVDARTGESRLASDAEPATCSSGQR